MLASIGALIAISAPANSPPPTSSAAAEQPVAAEASDGETLLSHYMDQLYGRRFDEALATAKKLSPDKTNRQAMAIVSAMRAGALLGLNQDSQSLKLFREADSGAPQLEFISVVQFISGLVTDKPAVALEAIDRMIARFPDTLRSLDAETVFYVLRKKPKDQQQRNDDRTVGLAQLGFGGDDGDFLTADAVEILIKRGDLAGATDLLQYIDEPRVIEDLLTRRRFSVIWPKVEAMAGPHLENVRNSVVEKAQRAYEAAPTDTRKLSDLANALRHAGRLDAAIALRAKLPATPAGMAAADEHMGWAVNYVALALHSAGRSDEADKLFALLNDAPMKGGSWRVSMKINRLELLVADGKFSQALPLLDVTEASAKDGGNDYARQLVRRLRYCALSGLGKADEAAKLLPDIMKRAEDARAATIDGLVCAAKFDEAEKLALTSLASSDFESSFVRSLQHTPLTDDDPSVWSQGWQELRKRPAIAKEFERLGRDMPPALTPPPPK